MHGSHVPVADEGLNAYCPPDVCPGGFAGLPTAAPNPALGTVTQYFSAGNANYNGLTIGLLRRVSSGFTYSLNYTWSHAIDNQTEPLAGLAVNLEVARSGGQGTPVRPASFTEQFNSSLDRGNSDFDERHNLTFYSTWNSPSRPGSWAPLLGGWETALIGAIRSGQPYTIYAPITDAAGVPGQLEYNRANLVNPGAIKQNTGPYLTGALLLNPYSFANPVNSLGNTGRNAFRGPGLYNVDLSLSRSFPFPWIGEAGRLILRADAYNFLNHANLSNPSQLSRCCADPAFVFGTFGRTDQAPGLPTTSPLTETARQVQLMLKIVF
jgi:hypothetical protein